MSWCCSHCEPGKCPENLSVSLRTDGSSVHPQGHPVSSSCCSEGAESCALKPHTESPIGYQPRAHSQIHGETSAPPAGMHASLPVPRDALGGKGVTLLPARSVLAKTGSCCFTLP